MQWADEDSLRLLRYVIRTEGASPIFMMFSIRPEELASLTEAVTLIADPAADGTGTVELNDDFACVATLSICTVTVAGPQTTQPKNTFLDEASQVLSANVEVRGTAPGMFATQ